MRSLPLLRRLVRQITLASLATAPLAAMPAACGGSTADDDGKITNGDSGVGFDSATQNDAKVGGDGATDAGIDAAGFETTVCDGATYRPITGLKPQVPVDYVELRGESDLLEPGDAGHQFTTGDKDGTPCATATNKTKCNADLAALGSYDGWVVPSYGNAAPMHTYLVYTRGDTVGLVKTLDELVSFLGPIDTAKEAGLLVTQKGYAFVCPSNNAKALPGGGYEVIARSGHTCGPEAHLDEHRIDVSSAGVVEVKETTLIQKGEPGCAIGRRPSGLLEAEGTPWNAPDEVARFFAAVARLEAASVPAFEQLARDLAWHAAPRELVRAALDAREDEVRHAVATRAIALRCGATVEMPEVVIGAPRALVDIALENAVEGCVRETFGALVASLQAGRAGNAAVREALSVIAEDETRHAALSWDIAAWVEPLLSDTERARVDAARLRALGELWNSLAEEPSADVQSFAGMPDRKIAESAFESLFGALGLSAAA